MKLTEKESLARRKGRKQRTPPVPTAPKGTLYSQQLQDTGLGSTQPDKEAPFA